MSTAFSTASAQPHLPLVPITRLQRREAFRLRACQGERIECCSGELWITQDGDPRDVIIEAHQCFTLDRAGTVVVSALKEASFVYRRHGSVTEKNLQRPAASHAAVALPDGAVAY